MKKAALGIFAIAALIGTPALAADMALKAPPPPPAPVYNWTGFYIGGTLGYGWGTSRQYDPLGDSTGQYSINGPVGGAEVGYNWQYQKVVLGLEADFSAANINGAGLTTPTWGCTGAIGTPPAGCSTTVDWFATQRGRVGYLVTDSLLAYGTAGIAEARVADAITSICALCTAPPTGTVTHSGWTAGGGLEYRFNQNVSAKIEYLHVDIGQYQWFTFLGGTDPGYSYARFDVVRGGLNWHFDWVGPASAPMVTK